MISKRALKRYIDSAIERKVIIFLDNHELSVSFILSDLRTAISYINKLKESATTKYQSDYLDSAQSMAKEVYSIFDRNVHADPARKAKNAIPLLKEAFLSVETSDGGGGTPNLPSVALSRVKFGLKSALAMCKALKAELKAKLKARF